MIKMRCPICDLPMDGPDTSAWPQYPFCSARCQTIDLGRWLGGTYRIAPESEGEAPADHNGESD